MPEASVDTLTASHTATAVDSVTGETESETVNAPINALPLTQSQTVNKPGKTGGKMFHDRALKEQCKLLYFQGLSPVNIAAQTGVNYGTLKVWATKHGWSRTVKAAREVMVSTGMRALTLETNQQLGAASAKLREKLADAAQSQAEAIALVPAKPRVDLIQEAANAIKTLAEAGKILHDWGADRPAGLVLGALLAADELQPEPIQIAAEVSTCAPNTPTACISEQVSNVTAPQDPQVTTTEQPAA